MVAVVGVLLGIFLLYLARGTLSRLLIAAVLAYALFPAVEWLHRRLHFPRTLSTITVYIVLLLLIVAIPILIGPLLVRQIRAIDLNLVELLIQIRQWLRQTLETWRTVELLGMAVDLSALVDPALEVLGEEGALPTIPPPETWLLRLLGMVPGAVTGMASTLISAATAFFLTLLYSFYLVKDSPEWGARLDGWLPETYRAEFTELRHRLSSIWRSFFRGQLALCLIIGLMSFVALSIMGIPGTIPLSLFAGLMEVIPNLGPLLALVPAVLVALIQGSTTLPLSHGWLALLVIGVYILIQQIENNFLVPRIIGGSVDLPPLVVLVGVVVGASNAGIVGAFLAAPVLASLRTLVTYAYNKILDRDPFPEKEKEKELRGGREEERASRPELAGTVEAEEQPGKIVGVGEEEAGECREGAGATDQGSPEGEEARDRGGARAAD